MEANKKNYGSYSGSGRPYRAVTAGCRNQYHKS